MKNPTPILGGTVDKGELRVLGADFGSRPAGIVIFTFSPNCASWSPRTVKNVPVLDVSFTDKKPKDSA